jgi:predicted Zn-dependent peptidase
MSLGAAIMVEELRNIERAVFPNGLTVLSEKMDHIRSVSMGIWVKSGSRHEDPRVNGISHFVEHMVFKGTRATWTPLPEKKRSASTGRCWTSTCR